MKSNQLSKKYDYKPPGVTLRWVKFPFTNKSNDDIHPKILVALAATTSMKKTFKLDRFSENLQGNNYFRKN